MFPYSFETHGDKGYSDDNVQPRSCHAGAGVGKIKRKIAECPDLAQKAVGQRHVARKVKELSAFAKRSDKGENHIACAQSPLGGKTPQGSHIVLFMFNELCPQDNENDFGNEELNQRQDRRKDKSQYCGKITQWIDEYFHKISLPQVARLPVMFYNEENAQGKHG